MVNSQTWTYPIAWTTSHVELLLRVSSNRALGADLLVSIFCELLVTMMNMKHIRCLWTIGPNFLWTFVCQDVENKISGNIIADCWPRGRVVGWFQNPERP